jgi:hypothetical protein
MPNQLLGVRLHTMAISRLSRVRTELGQLLIIPSLAPHPVEANIARTCIPENQTSLSADDRLRVLLSFTVSFSFDIIA